MTTNMINHEQNIVRINQKIMSNNFLINWYKMRIRYLRIIPESSIAIKKLSEKILQIQKKNDNLQAKKVLLTL